jgi:hypothetical protein
MVRLAGGLAAGLAAISLASVYGSLLRFVNPSGGMYRPAAGVMPTCVVLSLG